MTHNGFCLTEFVHFQDHRSGAEFRFPTVARFDCKTATLGRTEGFPRKSERETFNAETDVCHLSLFDPLTYRMKSDFDLARAEHNRISGTCFEAVMGDNRA